LVIISTKESQTKFDSIFTRGNSKTQLFLQHFLKPIKPEMLVQSPLHQQKTNNKQQQQQQENRYGSGKLGSNFQLRQAMAHQVSVAQTATQEPQGPKYFPESQQQLPVHQTIKDQCYKQQQIPVSR
jgi:hypothetical protein